ncbi:MAG: (2Fe-2S) ferredoxin domain-containing protein [Burkholderiaceae bacterium]|nr:MAG: (2Fe-2S) ferredoxin domain-containing protein [Burkholderiaceae bacterium]
MTKEDTEVYVCMNVDCKSRGAEGVLKRLDERLEELGMDHVTLEPYLCFSACQHGPNMIIPSKRCWFSGVTEEDINDIAEYLDGGAEIPRLTEHNDAGLKKLIFDIIDAGLLPGKGDFF